jgi:hypothetical protein
MAMPRNLSARVLRPCVGFVTDSRLPRFIPRPRSVATSEGAAGVTILSWLSSDHLQLWVAEHAMAVRCGGDSRAMEQLGEKQDFECELSRLGFKHEDFALHVRRANALGGGNAWTVNYVVRVTNIPVARHIFYWGGPGERWVEEFVADVANGVYGRSTIQPLAAPYQGRSARVE